MKFYCWLLGIALFIVLLGRVASQCKSPGTDVLPATALRPLGRTIINEQRHLELISAACHIGVEFEDTLCRVRVSLPQNFDHNYIQYELDGVYQKRVRINHETKTIDIKAATLGHHSVWLYKTTEAHTSAVVIHNIRAHHIRALQPPAAPLVEFIGNSITCGALADASEVPCGQGVYHDQHNAYMAYGPRVARALGVNYVLSSESGIGIYRNWNSDGPTMPEVYTKIDFQPNGPEWKFTHYTPQIVSIALGTNDFSAGDGKRARLPFDSALFVNKYIQFVQLVKSKYPAAQIALLSSPMINGANRQLLQNCLTTVKQRIDASYAGSKPVALFFFNPMQPRGCAYHPSVEDHAVLANELEPFFRKLLQ